MREFGNRIDRRVRLFSTEKFVLREIQTPWSEFYEKLWDAEVFTRLAEAKLIPPTERFVGPTPALQRPVFQQPLLPFVTYPCEWTSGMFRSAAEHCLKLHGALLKEGLCLHDSHAWNIVFDGVNPVWVDITSISRFQPDLARRSLVEFAFTFANPLRLMSQLQHEIVRSVLTHSFGQISDVLAGSVLPIVDAGSGGRVARVIRGHLAAQASISGALLRRIRRKLQFSETHFATPEATLKVVDQLRSEIERIPSIHAKQTWSEYVQAGQRPLSEEECRTGVLDADRIQNEKLKCIVAWLSKWKSECSNLLDIGCNKGLYAQIGCLIGYVAAGVDSDEGAVQAMFESARHRGMSLTCVVNDVVAPRETLGVTDNLLPRLEHRLQADVVLLLAAVHHFFWGRYQMGLGRITRLLATYSKRFAIVEFVPPEDKFLSEHYPDSRTPAGYSEKEFAAAIAQEFRVISVEPSFPAGRQLWILEKLK